MEILVVGLSHKTAPIELRERLYVAEADLPKPLEMLGESTDLVERMLVATCNRVEVYAAADGAVQKAVEGITDCLATYRNVPKADFLDKLYTYTAGEAVRHVFRVASSLDSMVVGEPQILGQVKTAYSIAQAREATGMILTNLMEQAFHVAKRVRSETGIATSAVSVSSAAVELARKIFGDLAGRSVLIIGAGEMAELALRHLLDDGVRSVLVANRSYDRAVALAQQFHGRAVTFEAFRQEMVSADIVISSTAAPHVILKKEDMQAIIQQRRHRPIFLIDIAHPRDIDPACNEVDNVYLYDIDDLQAVVASNLQERAGEAERAEAIIEREVGVYLNWLRSLDVVPTIVSLRERVEEIRDAELQKAMGRLGDLTPEQREAIAAMSRAMVNKILHQPMTELKRRAAHQEGPRYTTVLRRLFGLDPSPDIRRGTGASATPKVLRIGTRASVLALWQAKHVAARLQAAWPDANVSFVAMKTAGDKIQQVALSQVGGKALWVQSMEEALLDGRIDLIVHSMKDVPTDLPHGLTIAAVTEREDPRDVLISRSGLTLAELPPGAALGTSSLLRQAQILHRRPDLRMVVLRGNVHTRVRKLDAGELDAIIVAAAGIKRLGLSERITEYFSPDVCLPAIGQGVLGIEIRAEDSVTARAVAVLDHRETHRVILAERAFLRRLGGGCQVPVAAHGQVEGDSIRLKGLVASLDGKTIIEGEVAGPMTDPEALGASLADHLLEHGAAPILEELFGRPTSGGPHEAYD